MLALASLAVLRLTATQTPAGEKPNTAADKGISPEAMRLNTLGVAYMNQQKAAEAQKYFEQALAADPQFAAAKMNLGISFLGQQKVERARAALEEASAKLPQDPYAWYNLGLAYKDSNESEKAIAAFQHVERIVPEEPDAFYFEGFMNSQLLRYDEAIAAFQKALALNHFHASAQFGLARAYQRKGDAAAARESMKQFQKINSEHLGAPFGAGYGDQGKYSLAEFIHGTVATAPPEIPVHYTQEPLGQARLDGCRHRSSSGACFLDYDGDGKPDLFLVGAGEGKSRLLHNLGDGKFEDVTEKAGLGSVGGGFGCAAGISTATATPISPSAKRAACACFTTTARASSRT